MRKRKKNVVSIEDRIPKLKQARRKKTIRRLTFYLSIFLLLICVIVYLQSSLSYVKTIDITGNSFLTKEEIVKQSSLTEETNIWTVNRNNIEQRLKENKVVESVEVSRKLPWTIKIELNEFGHVGYIQTDNDYYPVLEDGTLLNSSRMFSGGNAPLLVGFDNEERLHRMASELNLLSTNILNLISEIHWQPTEENDNKIILYMNDGYVVDATIRNFASKMELYPSIISQLDENSRGIIHLGVGAYFEKFDE